MKKKILISITICIFMLSFLAKSQYVLMLAGGYSFKGVKADTLLFTVTCGAPTTTPGNYYHYSSIDYDTCGKGFYVYDPSTLTWSLIGSGDSDFPIYVDTLLRIDDSTFRWCKGLVCHDIIIGGGATIPYTRSNDGTTTASNMPQYSQGQKGSFSNTDTISSYYGNEVLRSYLTSGGIHRWFVNDGTREVGSISYSTPLGGYYSGILGGAPGIHFNDPSDKSRSQMHLLSGGGLSFGAMDSNTVGIPGTQLLLRSNGKVIITGRTGDYTTGEPYLIDSSEQGLFNVYGAIRSTNLIGTGNRNVAADANGNLVIDGTVGGGGGTVPISSLLAATASNTINNGNFPQEWQWNALGSNSALKLSSTSTAATGNSQTLLNIALSGGNANASQTTLGMQVSNTHTGTSSVNIGGYFAASGGTTNYAIQTAGAVDAQLNAVGTSTSTNGSIIENTTAATVGAQQYSPASTWKGNGWKTNSTAGSQQVVGHIQMQAVQSTVSPIGKFAIWAETNGGGVGNTLSVSSNGVATLQGAAGATLNVNGSVGIGLVHDETSGLQTASALELGTQLGSTVTALISSLASITATTNANISGVNINPQIGTATPHSSSQWYGGNFSMQAARSDFSSLPALMNGLKGGINWGGTGTSGALPLAYGVWGNFNLNSSVSKNATLAYGLYSTLSSGDGNPTGKVVTWKALQIDSANNNFYSTSNYGVYQAGTNATNFLAAPTLVGYNGSATPAVTSSALFQVQSTTQGVLFPRMSNTQRDAISSPAEGLLIYSLTDHAYEYYNGTAWKQITTL